ncbi:MAG: single-stranded-DNA-specific exonuclease RecJ, partial [Bacteroidales bacterium]|nr:single-stranded-DNA-specific exonuclease RecJ [Bacteroidales bacterium]
MEKRWVYKDQGGEELVQQLAGELSIDLNLSGLLVQRGIHTFEQARSYFRPQFEDLHDPFLMKDMDKAV